MPWVEIPRQWHDTSVTNCRLCGRLIPSRLWVVDIAGESLGFCSEDCERLYCTYWLPKYGDQVQETALLATEKR
jgi:hypothetical protein